MTDKELQRVTECVADIGHATARCPSPARGQHITQKARIAGQHPLVTGNGGPPPENRQKTGGGRFLPGQSGNPRRQFKRGQSGNPRRQFKPGQSGNPGGRPPLTVEEKQHETDLIQACRAKTASALTVICHLMVHARDATKLQAAQFIIERGWGKAVQFNEQSGNGPRQVNVTFRVVDPRTKEVRQIE